MAQTAPTRQVVAAAVALLVLGGIGAVKAGLAGADFMYDLEQVQPALARIEPIVDPTPTPRLARRVFVIVIDGLRYDKSYELPFLDELRRRGVDTTAVSHYPTWSRPNYVSILSGVPPTASGVRTNHHYTPVMLDTLMDRARVAGLRVATATDYEVLPRLFLRRRDLVDSREPIEIDIDDDDEVDIVALEDPLARAAVRSPGADLASPFHDARYAPWPGGFTEAGSALVAGDAELVILLVGAVDVAGHARGGASDEYREAALVADAAIARVLSKLDLAQDAVVVTADHGHTDRGGHGGIEPEVLEVPLVAAGAGIQPYATAEGARLIDIAPTVATLLGIPAPGHGLGRTLDELLELDPATRAHRRATDATRIAIARLTVSLAEQQADADVLEHRAGRLALVGGAAVLAIVFAVMLIRRRVLVLDLRVLVVSIPAFFIVYAALIALVGRGSPSFLPARGHIAQTLLWYGLGAIVVQLAASMWALRTRRTLADRLAAANGIAWTGLMLTMVPAGVSWAYFPPPFVTVPEPLWLVAIPAFEVAVACAAVNVALTLFIEVAVFVARAWQRDARALE
jgi:hypothetical protein